MICLVCEKISFSIICQNCQDLYLKANIIKRNITKEVPLYSFYNYDEINDLLLLKYKIIGSRVYEILAKNSFKIFAKSFDYKTNIYTIAIDDNIKKGYSHTSILAKHLKKKNISILHHALISTNNTQYANKSLEYRLQNPRDFIYKAKSNIDVILVDDIVVSGSTMKEAIAILEKNNVNVLFALCLCDKQ